jgi:hypothetical protein
LCCRVNQRSKGCDKEGEDVREGLHLSKFPDKCDVAFLFIEVRRIY